MDYFSICLLSIDFIIFKANVCAILGYYTPYLFIIKFATAERKIVQDQAVFLLSIIGKTNEEAT
jgi:hypothetical protein